jgi:hypothetical protein
MIGSAGDAKSRAPALHGRERVARVGAVHPRADVAVRMIDAHPVELVEHLLGARGDERRDRVRLRRVEDGESPRLPLGIRPAGRRAERVASRKRPW